MLLDARTVISIITISTLLIALGLALVARGPLGNIRGVSHWAIATLVQAGGWIVSGILRGQVPELWSILVGNLCIVGALVMYHLILSDFLGHRGHRKYWLFGHTALGIGLIYFTLQKNDVAVRSVLISAFVAAITLASARLLRQRARHMPSSRFMYGLYLFSGGFMLVRAFNFAFIETAPVQNAFSGSAFKDISLVIFFLFSVLLSFGFVLLCNERYAQQHHRVEGELLEKTRLFERLASQVPGTIYQYQRFENGRTCFPFASVGIEKMYELRAEDLIEDASAVLQRIHPDDTEMVVASIRESAQTLKPWRAQYRVVLPEQGLRWRSGQAQPERLPDGSVLWHGYIYDITEQAMVEARHKKLEQEVLDSYHALEASEQRLRRLMNSSIIGILQGNATGVLIEANDVLLQMLGLERRAVENSEANWFEFGQIPELTRQINAIRSLDQAESVPPFETQLVRKDGLIIPVMFGVAKLAESENEWVGFVLDLREQKRIDHLKSEFISIVSHELRTPLTSIRGAMGLLESGVMGELPPKALHLIQIAHKNSQRLTSLVNDILDMEKLATGKMRLNMQELDLRQVIEHAIESNAPYAETYQVSYQLHTQLTQAIVLADSDRIMQVLANLLSNAAKFSNQHDVVDVRLKDEPEHYVIEVEDHGRGIPAEFHDRIFGKFAQATDSSTRQKEGAGLGLHISKSLIEKMQGEIGFYSEEKMKTVFWIRLPRLMLDV
ncbi:ATP-binding protein [Undibacterium cyanobacteriorum]|uniref:histidine kinase n=1 Tax=Undibacterium cyanobacteriorum TaxID=3073561 RepID=A0ABY9RIT4_9BURK|nr:ATP-binding protein [Undibacterium sp. 20NA77.5]WMW81138.1 ATP-binding protein [Undibacterium sp. 20NA77.5]